MKTETYNSVKVILHAALIILLYFYLWGNQKKKEQLTYEIVEVAADLGTKNYRNSVMKAMIDGKFSIHECDSINKITLSKTIFQFKPTE